MFRFVSYSKLQAFSLLTVVRFSEVENKKKQFCCRFFHAFLSYRLTEMMHSYTFQQVLKLYNKLCLKV